MNSPLNQITDWPERAKQAKWSAAALARQCGVSVRTLHRYFLKHLRQNTKLWLAEQRHHNARELLSKGASVKETAACLGYQHPNNFTRYYKSRAGILPSNQKNYCTGRPSAVRE
jgi:transcriptional regulator GlxA family with amidase domain